MAVHQFTNINNFCLMQKKTLHILSIDSNYLISFSLLSIAEQKMQLQKLKNHKAQSFLS